MTLPSFYFAFNAALFLAAGIYCLLARATVPLRLGFADLDESGYSEFITVYGGMQIGIAAFFGYLATQPGVQSVGLVFSVLFYGGIATLRVVSLLRFRHLHTLTYKLAAGEVLLLLSALGLMCFG
ncbi:MAG: DUF4345 domain-containing protein [Pseudomonadota bacterium]